jgi:uncharacterized membrane protein YagU involved in acid resistance
METTRSIGSTTRAVPCAPASFRIDLALVFSSGFLATLVITTVMLLLLWFGVAQVDLPIWVARLFVSDPVKVQAVGLGIHLTMGLAFAWVFALVEPQLRFSPSQNGLIFGVALWAMVQAIGVPTLSAVAALIRANDSVFAGWCSSRLGVGAAMASLVAHLAYGVSLGVVYGRQRNR